MKFLKKLLLSRGVFALLAVGVLTACGSTPSYSQTGSGMPIIVIGEDSDRASMPRSSDVFRRVINQIKSILNRKNFAVIEEAMMAAEFGWKMTDRRPQTEVLQVGLDAKNSSNMSYHARALVSFKIKAQSKKIGKRKIAFVRVSGEIYDLDARTQIGSFQMPVKKFRQEGLPMEELVGEHARDMAAEVADEIQRSLVHMISESSGAGGTGGGFGAGGTGGGLFALTQYTFRNFLQTELDIITGVIEDEWPPVGKTSVRGVSGGSAAYKFGYVSPTKVRKQLRWLNIVLMDMGLDPNTNVKVTSSGRKVEVNKLFDTPPFAAKDPNAKFN